MDLHLRGRTALISGGSKGIGRAAAESLAAEGCDLVLVSRTLATLEETAVAIRARHQVSVRVRAADLSVQGAAEDLSAQFPDVDILVNNAGAIPGGSLAQVDGTTLRQAWQLKVFSYIDLCRAFYPLLKARSSPALHSLHRQRDRQRGRDARPRLYLRRDGQRRSLRLHPLARGGRAERRPACGRPLAGAGRDRPVG